MVTSEVWSFWRKTNQASSKKVKDTVLDDAWWERVDLTIKIMEHIISLLQFADTDKPILREVYEAWDSMIESMRTIILQNEFPGYGTPAKIFFTTIQDILINRWNKNYTPLHMGYIPHVVMLIFIISPRPCGPSWKRGRGSHTHKSWYYTKIYLIKDQVALGLIWVLSTKVQDQGSTHALDMGTLEHI
jgi:hypothetical protein